MIYKMRIQVHRTTTYDVEVEAESDFDACDIIHGKISDGDYLDTEVFPCDEHTSDIDVVTREEAQ